MTDITKVYSRPCGRMVSRLPTMNSEARDSGFEPQQGHNLIILLFLLTNLSDLITLP